MRGSRPIVPKARKTVCYEIGFVADNNLEMIACEMKIWNIGSLSTEIYDFNASKIERLQNVSIQSQHKNERTNTIFRATNGYSVDDICSIYYIMIYDDICRFRLWSFA